MTRTKSGILTFFAGVETFHALTHAYLSLSKTKLKWHPAEILGIKVNPKFHAAAALGNAVIAVALGVMAQKSLSRVRPALQRLDEKPNAGLSAIAS
ncbi:hypothetical protein K2X30_13355 [bacterium]|nr:hypothetical protein [bacterium]